MKLTLRDILSIAPLEVRHRERLVPFTGVSTDTRTLKTGDLFVALRGANFDGHRFLADAVARGASGVMVEAESAHDLPPGLPAVLVQESTAALGLLARAYRRKFQIPLLAVGGSSGKTTTKEMAAAVLAQRYRVLATAKNYNNQIGVPMTLFRLEKKDEIAVVEVGTNHPGELAWLCTVAEPTHGILTNIGAEHLEFFGSVDGVAKEEGVLFGWCAAHKATAIVNTDDARVVRAARGVGTVLTYGFRSPRAAVRGRGLRLTAEGTARFTFTGGRTRRPVPVDLMIPGRHHGLNALAAAAVGTLFKVPSRAIAEGLAAFTGSDKRMAVLTIGGVTILNDTYNANPDSTAAALETLAALKVRGKRIAVLADMLELGEAAGAEHRRMGEIAAGLGIEYLLVYGPLSREIARGAGGKIFTAHYEEKNALAEYLAELVAPGDAVLLKGSRGMAMESLVPFLEERLQRTR
jgi:UDP-N-acetylmuramoyl-tripeptide--D-alanyl-D-alanine ligase